MLLPLIVAVPCAGAVTALIESVSPSGSLSLASTAIVTGVANAVVAVSFAATGGRFGWAATTTVTLAELVPPWPSSIVYVKRAVPEKPGDGVNTIVVPRIETRPPFGCVTLAIVSALPSGSLSFASTLIVTPRPNVVLALSGWACGARFGAPDTVIVTFALATPPLPSPIV